MFNNRYLELSKNYLHGSTRKLSVEESALLYILSENNKLYSIHKDIVDLENREIKLDFIEKMGVLSSSERALVKLAFNLFNGYNGELEAGEDYSPVALLKYLDVENLKIAICAIKIRFN